MEPVASAASSIAHQSDRMPFPPLARGGCGTGGSPPSGGDVSFPASATNGAPLLHSLRSSREDVDTPILTSHSSDGSGTPSNVIRIQKCTSGTLLCFLCKCDLNTKFA